MAPFFKKKYLIPIVASAFLFVGASFKNDFFEIAKQIEIFTTLFKELNTNYVDETNPGELMDSAIKGMLASLDPYTVYFNEQDVLRFKINNTGEYTGIGALITRKEDKLIIKEIYKNFPADKGDLAIDKSIIDLCHALGKVVVAEGVETHEQLVTLTSLGCDSIQGYYIAKAMPADLIKTDSPFFNMPMDLAQEETA